MAATIITAKLVAQPVDRSLESLAYDTAYVIDSQNPDFVGIETAATHDLVTIPKGDAFLGAKVIVTTAFTSAGSATLRFAINGASLIGVIPKADLTVGEVFDLTLNDLDATVGLTAYADSADITFDWIVGTATLTAGAITLIISVAKNIS